MAADRRIRSIVILGGGTAGWMTAAALSKVNDPRQFEITLIESDEIGTIGVGEATIPTIHWFNQLVGLDEAEFMRATQATYKLGIEFPDWAGPSSTYLHPFGRYGGAHDQSMFYHRWIRARLGGLTDSYEAYSLTTQAARAGKFSPPSRDPNSLLSTLGYAFHFDASLYARFLRRRAEAAGVQRREGKVVRIDQDPGSGFVTALTTDKGEVFAGDLFIDCSGIRGVLIEQTLKVGFDDWSHWLPCDRALAVPSENGGPPHPFTRATARRAGWQWRIPLQHRTGNGHVYCSHFMSDDEAARVLLDNLAGQPLAEPRPIRFTAGTRSKAWDKNVVAIGLSAGFLEPLESTSIHLIQSGIAKLLSLFPARDCDPFTAEQFNRVFRADIESARDFITLHYHANGYGKEPLWEHCRHMSLPEGLDYKIEHFRRTGRIVLSSDELFREASWFAVFMGQGIHPRDYNPLVDAYSASENSAHLARLKTSIAEMCARLPAHQDYLETNHRLANSSHKPVEPMQAL
ncbi:MAG TPA: tryptophan halogenase family protein [Caulobacteraceae bacterium]|jgi:tryptophan halogenase